MALGTPTLLTGIGAAGATVTSVSVTPVANSRVYVCCNAFNSSGNPSQPTISDSVGLTWVPFIDVLFATGSNPRLRQRVWRADVGASPAPMTITVGSVGGSQTHMQAICQTGGASNDYTNFSWGQDFAGDPTVNLNSAPAATSTVIAFATAAGGNSLNKPASFANLQDSELSTARRSEVCYDTTSPSQTFGWVSTNVATQAVAFEVKDSSFSPVSGFAISGHAKIHGYVGVATISTPQVATATSGHALLHGYVGSVIASQVQRAFATAGHALIHGYAGSVVASNHIKAFATSGHAVIHGFAGSASLTDRIRAFAISGHARAHGYIGVSRLSNNIRSFAVSGHARAHGYQGFVRASNFKAAFALAGHAKAHGYVGVAKASDRKKVFATNGHALVQGFDANVTIGDAQSAIATAGLISATGFSGSVSLTDNIKVEAISSLLQAFGSVGYIFTGIPGHYQPADAALLRVTGSVGVVKLPTNPPPSDRTIRVTKENRSFAVRKENRTILTVKENRTITVDSISRIITSKAA